MSNSAARAKVEAADKGLELAHDLFERVWQEDEEGLEALLEQNKEILDYEEQYTRNTAAMWASAWGKGKALAWLIQAGASLQKTNAQGDQAVHLATYAGQIPILGMLSEAGAHLDVEGNGGLLPSEWAEDHGMETLATTLDAMLEEQLAREDDEEERDL